jgi:membrane protein required for colicin V production
MEGLTLNWFDIGVIAIVLLSALMAFFRGFLREIFSIVAFIGAAAAAIFLHQLVTPLMATMMPPTVATFAAGLAVFVASFVIISLLTAMITQISHRNGDIGLLDRGLGLVFGALRGAVIPLLAVVVLRGITPADRMPEWLVEARTYPIFTAAADAIGKYGLPGVRGEATDPTAPV